MGASERRTTPASVLTAWTALHARAHPLTASQRMQFIQHPSMSDICSYPFDQVYACLVKHRKLDEVLRALQRGEGSGSESSTQDSRSSTQRKKPTHRGTQPRVRSKSQTGSKKGEKPVPRKSQARSGPTDSRSRLSSRRDLINKPPAATPDEARRATPDFDKKNRPDYN